ncbi:PREDICTED: nuclear polyadenylated RNA-binding protein 3-like [Papilio xuthus]|uniref:Nuclear polyadenylated RNA-binding protein 3-like n=1 Tax=Papilio xuthus TaxID=66420 RepID=A0AAJ6Z0M5_PAPXU|nr:PREDICTED: nuclear polyadenylated RNA-binding protein 3-like [Papilio xuthus]
MSIKITAACFALYLYISTCESNPCSYQQGYDNKGFFIPEVYDDLINDNCNVCIGRPYPKVPENQYNPSDNKESGYESQDCYTENTIIDEECEATGDDENETEYEGKNSAKYDDENEPEENNKYKSSSKYEYEPNNDDDDDEDKYQPKYDNDEDDDDEDDDDDCGECDSE